MGKNMRIEHRHRVANGTRYEVNNIYAPGTSVIPIHTFERNYPVDFMDEFGCAIQSLTFADIIATKFKKKYKATGIVATSTVAGAAEMYMAALESE